MTMNAFIRLDMKRMLEFSFEIKVNMIIEHFLIIFYIFKKKE